MRRFIPGIGARVGHSSTRSMTALDEPHALQEALASASLIMNDNMEQAEAELSKGTSPFHKLALATAVFLRAVLGFEKDVMEQASIRIAEAEESAAEHQRRAIRDPSTAHQSAIYPPGAEYGLCHAEAQLMSAVVAVLNESLTESLRGFYKLRKAFSTLYEISEAEKSYMRRHNGANERPSSSTTADKESLNQADESAYSSGVLTPISADEDDEDEFVDAKEAHSAPDSPRDFEKELSDPEKAVLSRQETLTQRLNRVLSFSGQTPGVQAIETTSKSAAEAADQEIDFTTISADPVDIFIHSGNCLCFGLLQLMLSLVPPSFAKLLSIFSFRGDREAGLRMLWEATKFNRNINGAMAGLMTLGFHNAPISFCDILTQEALPEARLRSLLIEMRRLYPQSKLWLLEESRVYSRDKKLEEAVSVIVNGRKSNLKQVEALGQFEMSLNLMYQQRYQDCADSFITCVGLNNWSHALYYYIAGSCFIELYRIAKASDPEKAELYATKAEKHLREVLSHVGKKRFMARQLPFDVFVARKITKWDARAKSRDCKFVDAVGVSPVVEMIYFWSGFRRMRTEHVEICLERLAWSENAASGESDAADERAALNFLRGVSLRCLGRREEAVSIFNEKVFSHDLHTLKSCEHPETWPLPAGHYEMAVCYWQEANKSDGSPDRANLRRCSEELSKVEKWESFELETRIGLKITTARETLRKLGIGPP